MCPFFALGVTLWAVVRCERRAQRNALGHLAFRWLSTFGCSKTVFSIGIGDTIADYGTMEVIMQTIAERKGNIAQIIDDTTHDWLKAGPGMTIRKTFESAEGHHCHRGHERVLGDSLLFKGPVTKRNVLVARIKRENSDERFTYRHTRIRTGRWSLRTASRSHQANITIFTSL